MIELNLKNIILNADFSPLEMGYSESDVVRILGDPDDRYDNGKGSVLYVYGWYELFFFDGLLHYFQNDHVKADCSNHADGILYENENFTINPWFLKPDHDISLKEVIALLENEEADFVVRNQMVAGKEYAVGEVKIVELSNGIQMDFHNNSVMFHLDEATGVVDAQEVFFQHEMDFVLNGIRYDHFGREEQVLGPV